MEYKLSVESAEAELQRLIEYYEIDTEDLPEDQIQAAEISMGRILKAIRLGRLEIGEDGCTLTQHLRNPLGESTTIEYAEITGKAKMAMKGKDINDYHGRCYALLGSLSGLGEKAISSLRSVDVSLAESIGILFLQI